MLEILLFEFLSPGDFALINIGSWESKEQDYLTTTINGVSLC